MFQRSPKFLNLFQYQDFFGQLNVKTPNLNLETIWTVSIRGYKKFYVSNNYQAGNLSTPASNHDYLAL